MSWNDRSAFRNNSVNDVDFYLNVSHRVIFPLVHSAKWNSLLNLIFERKCILWWNYMIEVINVLGIVFEINSLPGISQRDIWHHRAYLNLTIDDVIQIIPKVKLPLIYWTGQKSKYRKAWKWTKVEQFDFRFDQNQKGLHIIFLDVIRINAECDKMRRKNAFTYWKSFDRVQEVRFKNIFSSFLKNILWFLVQRKQP